MGHPKIKKPIPIATPARYLMRAETSAGIDEIGSGRVLADEIGVAQSYHARTLRKVWIIDLRTGRTVHRIERAQAAGGAR